MLHSMCGNCEKQLRDQIISKADGGKEMSLKSLDVCTKDWHSEHIRLLDEDDACDDGRSGLRD